MQSLVRMQALLLQRGSILVLLGLTALVIGLLTMHTSPGTHNAPGASLMVGQASACNCPTTATS